MDSRLNVGTEDSTNTVDAMGWEGLLRLTPLNAVELATPDALVNLRDLVAFPVSESDPHEEGFSLQEGVLIDWDKQVEVDARSGRLDRFRNEARKDYLEGNVEDL